MINVLKISSAIIIWVGLLALQVILMAIAHFFQRTSKQWTGYQLYVLPILFTCIGMIRYFISMHNTTRWTDLTGDPLANVLFLAAGLLLLALGNLLYTKMMGSQNYDGD